MKVQFAEWAEENIAYDAELYATKDTMDIPLTFSLEESGWELGGIGFRSQLAINNSKYLICNRNHNSQKLTMRASSLHA